MTSLAIVTFKPNYQLHGPLCSVLNFSYDCELLADQKGANMGTFP